MSVDSLLAQHVRILNAASSLEQLCVGRVPAAAPAIARSLWALARDLLLHLDEVEAQLYARLADVRRAADAIAGADGLVAALHAHVERWHRAPMIDAWPEQCAALRDLTAATRARLDQEARDIVTLLPALPPARAVLPPRGGYAAEAWQLHEMLFGRDPLPLA